MSQQPNILTAHEPMVDGQNRPTRTWWRFFDSIKNQSGTTATPLQVKQSLFLSETTVSSGGTISSPDLAPRTLIGNTDTVAASAEAVPIGASLSTASGSLDVQPVAGLSLYGNGGTIAATGSSIAISTNLQFVNGSTLDTVGTNNTDLEVLVQTIRPPAGQLASLEQRMALLEINIGLIRDQRGGIAALQSAVAEAKVLSFLSDRRSP